METVSFSIDNRYGAAYLSLIVLNFLALVLLCYVWRHRWAKAFVRLLLAVNSPVVVLLTIIIVDSARHPPYRNGSPQYYFLFAPIALSLPLLFEFLVLLVALSQIPRRPEGQAAKGENPQRLPGQRGKVETEK